jgi:hypothetical protein
MTTLLLAGSIIRTETPDTIDHPITIEQVEDAYEKGVIDGHNLEILNDE